ncbi:hypothetical protein QEH42_gp124 [Microbacterium phage Pumpernickel]|uniref:DUF2188 domain-containing protein n=1 Tax=Microbacterium phage Pumpernickel TaxID=2885983 RepID=A0AAE8Y702_9CAUD|nr:hypothetical protein QEH42_gp043 [Microbacterium phage Pumpernickel]YP_010755334.1 hypothetical protein QEH42_gp124 [Microbacterium phage Pumpernickel]UDL15834.1 hypothetical protein SEA_PUMPERNICKEL_43 [Microbacterium phage Pumpernickel]UDL16094.1 hypothetical protein SEA_PUMPERNICKEL_344 [Microbacterium phage Pumpernickel]
MKTWTITQTRSFWVVTSPEGKSAHVAKPVGSTLTEAEALAKGQRILAARVARVGG